MTQERKGFAKNRRTPREIVRPSGTHEREQTTPVEDTSEGSESLCSCYNSASMGASTLLVVPQH